MRAAAIIAAAAVVGLSACGGGTPVEESDAYLDLAAYVEELEGLWSQAEGEVVKADARTADARSEVEALQAEVALLRAELETVEASVSAKALALAQEMLVEPEPEPVVEAPAVSPWMRDCLAALGAGSEARCEYLSEQYRQGAP